MTTKIFEGLNGLGTCFIDSDKSRAFGPVFPNVKEARDCLSWMGGQYCEEFYDVWIREGKLPYRTIPQFSNDLLVEVPDPKHAVCLGCDWDSLHENQDDNGNTQWIPHCVCARLHGFYLGEWFSDENGDWENGKCSLDNGATKWKIVIDFKNTCFPFIRKTSIFHVDEDIRNALNQANIIPPRGWGWNPIGEGKCFKEFETLEEGLQFIQKVNSWLDKVNQELIENYEKFILQNTIFSQMIRR